MDFRCAPHSNVLVNRQQPTVHAIDITFEFARISVKLRIQFRFVVAIRGGVDVDVERWLQTME